MKFPTVARLHFYSILAVAVTIPLTIKLNSIFLILCLLITIYRFFSEKLRLNNSKLVLHFCFFYGIFFWGLINSENLRPAYFDLEQKASLLVIPLMFSMIPTLDQEKVKRILLSFVISVLFVSLLSLRNGIYWGYSSDLLTNSLLVHRPYMGIYLVFSFFICVYYYPTFHNPKLKVGVVLSIAFLLFYLVLLFAKMAIVSFAVLSCFYFLSRLYTRNRSFVYYFIGILIASIIALATFTYQGREITKKVFTLREFEWKNYDEALVNSLNLRFIKWTCSAKVLMQDNNWLVGAGVGDVKAMLNKCYSDRLGESSFFVTESFNSHNQFLTIWLNLGLIGLFFLMYHYVVFFRIHIKRRDKLALLFTLGFFLAGVTESVLEVQKGVVFYSFFQSLFIFYHKDDSPVG